MRTGTVVTTLILMLWCRLRLSIAADMESFTVNGLRWIVRTEHRVRYRVCQHVLSVEERPF